MIFKCCFPKAHYPSLLSVQHSTKGTFAVSKQHLWLLLGAAAPLALGSKALQEAERMPSRLCVNTVLKRKRQLFAAGQIQTDKNMKIWFSHFCHFPPSCPGQKLRIWLKSHLFDSIHYSFNSFATLLIHSFLPSQAIFLPFPMSSALL